MAERRAPCARSPGPGPGSGSRPSCDLRQRLQGDGSRAQGGGSRLGSGGSSRPAQGKLPVPQAQRGLGREILSFLQHFFFYFLGSFPPCCVPFQCTLSLSLSVYVLFRESFEDQQEIAYLEKRSSRERGLCSLGPLSQCTVTVYGGLLTGFGLRPQLV